MPYLHDVFGFLCFGFFSSSFATGIRMMLALCHVMARVGIGGDFFHTRSGTTGSLEVRCCGISFKSGNLGYWQIAIRNALSSQGQSGN